MNVSALRLRPTALIILTTAITSAVFLQCVGDDPSATSPSTDGTDASTGDSSTDAPSTSEAGTDAGPATCAWDAKFDTPVAVPGIPAGTAIEGHPSLSSDELTIYFHGKGGALNDASTDDDLFMALRSTKTDAFGLPVRLTISTNFADSNPTVSHDGTTLYYDSTDGGPSSTLWIAKRSAPPLQFSGQAMVPSPPAGFNDDDGQPFLTDDGVQLWFTSRRDGGLGSLDVYSSDSDGGAFGVANLQPALSSGLADYSPSLSFDRLTVYVSSSRLSPGNNDILRSHRLTVNDPFPTPVAVTELNSLQAEFGGWLSPDNCRYYFETTRGGQSNLYMAERSP